MLLKVEMNIEMRQNSVTTHTSGPQIPHKRSNTRTHVEIAQMGDPARLLARSFV
jgi:hypothetical protein